MNEYMAMIRPSYGMGSFDKFFEAESDEQAIEMAKGFPWFSQELLGVYIVHGNKGDPI